MDQGNPAQGNPAQGDAVAAPSRAWLTPLRAALAVVGSVLGGAALSLVLGSSPAHAAENPGPDHGPLIPVASGVSPTVTAATATVASAVDGAIPGTQQVLHAVNGSLVDTVPASEPLAGPAVGAVRTALTAVDQAVVPIIWPVVAPVVDGILPLGPRVPAFIVDGALAPAFSLPFVIGPPSATATGAVLAPTGTARPDAPLPTPVLTSSASAPAAALCILFLTLVALAMPGRRKRLRDDAMPASPVFETDTSPA